MIFRFIVLGISLAAAILPWPAGRRQNAPASRPAETGAIEKEPGDLLSQLEAWLAQHGRPAAEPQDGNGSDGSGPGTRGVPVPDDVISREFSFLNGPDADAPGDVLSREFSFLNGPDADAPGDVISREFSFLNGPNADAPGDVLSREFSFLNGPDADAPSDVISREFSFVNETPRDATDVVSREFSYYVPTIDLRVSSIAAVASADIGARIDLEWTVINAGAETASGSWVDQVYVSTDAVLDAADVLVASRTVTRVVLPGDSYTRYATIFLPPTPGDYHILVVVDATNQLFEAEAEVNNTGERPIQVVTAPLADLFVAGIAPPASLEPGLPQAVSWTVENRSPDAIAHGSWTETVHYSSDGTIGCDTLVGSFSYSGDLAAGASILRTELITLPAGTVLGTGWLVLCVDTTSSPWPYHEVLEVDESNNCTIQQICVDCLQPDLAVTATATISDATAGDTIVVEYSVSNSGQEPTVGTWRDAIYLSTDDQLGPSDVQLRLDTISRPALLPGESYSISRSVTLPASTPNGVMRIVVRTDDSAAQVDLQRSNNVRASAELAVTALPLPDLEAQAVQLTPPDIAAFGDTITVEWMAANVGTAAALSPWSDRIFLSSDALLSPDDRPLGTPVNSNAHPLNPGDPPYAGSADVVLAYDRTPVEGNYYVLAVIDANGAVGELDESNNVIASLPIYLTVPPLPNLAVTITQAPGLVRVGESAHVEWRVTNAGNQPISQTDAFLLAVQVSGDAGIGADSTLVLIPSGAPFAADESREYSADVTVPELSTAELRFVVCADTSNEVIEAVEVDNCTIAETASVYGRPDLTVSSVSAPPVAIAGSTAVVTLTVSNDGNATARPFWIDGVYLSHDNAVGEDTLVGVATRSGALTSPGAYDVPVSISIPNTFEGEYRVVAEVDRGDRVIEIGIPTNNFRVAAASLVISQPPRPNLVVSNISTPAAGLSGGRLMAEWTVSNSGGASLTGTWFERVYASRDGVFGPDDLLLGEFLEQNRTLAAADSYVAAHEVAYPSEPGPWRLIVRFDATDTVFEGLTGEADNLSIDDAMFDVATFTATAEADIVDAPAGTPVVISGVTSQAGSGNPAPDVPVTVHVKTRGFDRKIIARTDATGHFQTTFSPTPNEGGRYDVSAGPAHEASPPATDQFRLWALIVTPATLATRIVPNIPFAGQIQLENPGDLPETGIQISTSGAPASIQVNVTPPDGNSLPQLTTVSLPFTIVAISADPAPGPFDIVITSAQGATTHFTLDLTVGPAQPRLEAVARDLQGGVLRAAVSPGMRSFAQFRVRNIGGVETGPVLVTRSPTPAWISMATAQFLDSIMPGADGSVVLQFDPPATEPVGGAYTLTVTLRAGTSEIYVPLRIDVVSEWIGDLHVTATDQFTYYDAAAPNVDGARVSVYDARTNELIASALTDGNGQADFTGLAEAYYTIEGSAVQHSGYRATQFVRGGQSNSVEAFMPFEPVTYTWTVVPTEFEDQYRIVIDAVFETQVPWPVLTLTPMAVDGLSLPNPGQIDYEIHNIGLIQASNVRLSVSDGGVFDLTPLATNLGDMLPDARVTVPAIVSRTRDVDCGTALVSVCWDVPCGNRVYTFCIPALVYDHGCPGSPPTGGTPPGGSGDGGGGDSYFPPPTTSQSLPCNPCAIDCLLTATCLLPIPPIFELPCAIETVQGCIEDLILDSPDAWLPPAVDCIASGLECAGVISEELAERLNKLFCLCEIARDCRQNCDENRDCFPCGYGDIWRLLRDYVNNRGCFARGLDDPLSQYYRTQYVRVMDVLTAGSGFSCPAPRRGSWMHG
ncbi:MAG: hypothetical protein HZB38_11270 [Planctomycetes bacterium]|nr:hypothetical protein [Planctomycetota bacterium]